MMGRAMTSVRTNSGERDCQRAARRGAAVVLRFLKGVEI